MKAPISWLKEHVKIKTDLKDLMWKMTEAGMTTETFEKIDNDIVLDIEVTPNRPDWLSILGVAREISAIENIKLNQPKFVSIPSKKADLPIKISIDHQLSGRYTAITMEGVKVKDSPDWMKRYLKLVGLRPINNLVDITNFVMLELGVPIHVFDYDKFKNKDLIMQRSKGGEKFTSVDGIAYTLPKDAIIIKDGDTVVDLCGIKGGKNSAIDPSTKNIYIHLPIYSPILIRKTSQKLKLSSDASYIYERGADMGGTINSLKRVVELTMKYAGGKIASEIIDHKDNIDLKKIITLNHNQLEKVLGIEVDRSRVAKILKILGLDPKTKDEDYICDVPTFRQDLNIQEDLIEEVARIYGYNNFPKTMPIGKYNTQSISYKYDHKFEFKIKNILSSGGYNEVMTLSLISDQMISNSLLSNESHIRIANPVSNEYEYLRTSLIPNLLKAVKQNDNHDTVKLFEYGKVFIGPVDKRQENYMISTITNTGDLRKAKGISDLLLDKLNIKDIEIKGFDQMDGLWHSNRSAVISAKNEVIGNYGYINPKVLHNFNIDHEVFGFEYNIEMLKKYSNENIFVPINKYPSQIEDITIKPPKGFGYIDIVKDIKTASSMVHKVELTEIFEDKYTIRIEYLNTKKTLTDSDVEKIRKKITTKLIKKGVGIDI